MRLKGRHSKPEEAPVAAPRTDEDDERLGRILVGAGRVQPYQLDAVREEEGALATKLIASGAITDDALARINTIVLDPERKAVFNSSALISPPANARSRSRIAHIDDDPFAVVRRAVAVAVQEQLT